MTAILDDAMIKEYEASFIARNDKVLRWSDAVSQMQMLPGLRGLWPMSAFEAGGNAFDLSGNGRTLTYNGNPTYNYDQYGRVPYIDLDGTGDYLSRGDEAGLDILGTESYVHGDMKGLTMGGWFWFDTMTANTTIIGKGRWVLADLAFMLWQPSGTQVSGGIYNASTGYHSPFASISTGVWHNLVLRFIPSEEVTLFANGISYSNVVGIPASIQNSGFGFGIGYITDAPNDTDGRASSCFLCAAALPDSQILSLYHSQKHFFGV